MNETVIACLAFAVIFGATLLGMRLRAALPDDHLSSETKDAVRLGMGLVATMTALLLGLLVASAKGSYDTQRGEVIVMAARIAFLDRVLTIYGPETAEARELVRRVTEGAINQMWPDNKSQEARMDPVSSQAQAMFGLLQGLTPQNDTQRFTKAQALETATEISKTRWLLFAQRDSSIAKPFLVIVIFWLAVTFLSFGLFAPSNKTVIATMFIAALSVSTALFLIMELDRPFDGVIRVSSAPMRNTLDNLGR